MVLKPAETTPLTALKLAEIMQDADLPPGVVNIVTGAGETGAALVKHPDIDKIAFTGSTEVGKIIQEVARRHREETTRSSSAARRPTSSSTTRRSIRPSKASSTASSSTRATSAAPARGCSCRNRCPTKSIRKLKDRMETLIVGDPLDKNTDIGAINSAAQLEKIDEYLRIGADGRRDASELGGRPRRPATGAARRSSPASRNRAASCRRKSSARCSRCRPSAPSEEAIEKANNTPYGLSGGVWTDKGSKIFKMTRNLRAGVIWANTYNKFDPSAPFGGYKESGIGREGGLHGLSRT